MEHLPNPKKNTSDIALDHKLLNVFCSQLKRAFPEHTIEAFGDILLQTIHSLHDVTLCRGAHAGDH